MKNFIELGFYSFASNINFINLQGTAILIMNSNPIINFDQDIILE